jgi:hypothetical protein
MQLQGRTQSKVPDEMLVRGNRADDLLAPLFHNSYLRASGNPERANLAMSSPPKGKWRDPDSNRGHHYPQLAKARSPLFLTAQKSA